MYNFCCSLSHHLALHFYFAIFFICISICRSVPISRFLSLLLTDTVIAGAHNPFDPRFCYMYSRW